MPEVVEGTRSDPWRETPPVRPRDILDALIRMRAPRGGLTEPPPTRDPLPSPMASGFGCLRRVVMLVIILAVLAVLAFVSLFGVGGYFYSATGSIPSSADPVAVIVTVTPAVKRGHAPPG